MLKSIVIHNYALVESVEVDFSSGFSVITGETGAGKSVFLGAISMMLGQRSDVKAIREGADRCVIEGHFDISSFSLQSFFEENELDYCADDCIVRRELTASGRSRAFVNDTPVSAALLKELGARLIDIHSQHRNLLLGDRNFQLDVLDVIAGNEEYLAQYKQTYAEYTEAQKRLLVLEEELEKNRSDEDWLRYRLEEIESASLRVGEQQELESEQQELAHAEDIQAALYGAYSAIEGDENISLLHSLRDAANALSRVAAHYPAAKELSERLDSNYIELKDCCDELQQRSSRVQFSPDRFDFVNNRLALIYELEKKYRVESVDDIIALGKSYREKLEHIDNGDWELKEAEKRCEALKATLRQHSEILSRERHAAAERLKTRIVDVLVNLGMPMIRFEVDFSSVDFTTTGCDAVTFLFSANSSSRPQPLADVASGGEMARVMLALKSLIAIDTNQPTLIFDEIDTGISGVLAERMGRLMQQMGTTNRQVLSITHLPQVAALGSVHYKVYKEETPKGTITNIIKLNEEERVREIAQMMSGEVLTDAALDNAALLLSKS